MTLILIFFSAFFAIRLVFLRISIKNEKKLIERGARQVGTKTSIMLALAHIFYYFASIFEAYITNAHFSSISIFGVITLSLSFIVLFYIVKILGEIWTVKVYILPNHQINRTWIFKYFRHPNYFLNIIPELIGVSLLCQAWRVMIVGLPLYFIILALRIYQEQKAMQHLF